MELYGTDRIRQSHHFEGRFENLYLQESDVPDIATLLEVVKQQAALVLGVTVATLKAGFWFNAMNAGQRTSLHHHDENDEMLSAVYYIHVPENSGDLILHDAGNTVRIRPQEGKLVMFAPGVLHEVTAHLGTGLRLSVAMNVGPIDD
ncbi:MAG: putative 2OG-Fe(II) oxygenase [Gammaproteobacteria bacterium]